VNWNCKQCLWFRGFDTVNHALDSMSFDQNSDWGTRSSYVFSYLRKDRSQTFPITTSAKINVQPVSTVAEPADLWIYDPPYADAVDYHEITEFFIAWLRKDPPAPFDQWTWDSRRPLAIQGKGEKFRTDMVDAFRAMRDRMPENGMHVCMFTHQDAAVWADMAGIVWGSGLKVTAAWYVSTETTSDLKAGGYVQGTVLLVLRKRQGDERAYKDELVLEIRTAVQRQVDLLTGLNQRAKALQRDENPFSDADVQMAGYAAALEVLTGYTHVEGMDMTREALRPRVKGKIDIVEEMIGLAVQTATEMMRPVGIDGALWERLSPTERFWLKMTEAEANRATGQAVGKLDDYQNFAKAYRADGWDGLMADQTPNKARLKSAADFKRAMMTGHPFAGGLVRPVLYAVNELRIAVEREDDHEVSGQRAVSGLRDNLTSWAAQRQQAMVVADWLGRTLNRQHPGEASAARTLAALIRNERLG
jgi:putative DNA methylase